ncbi:Crp/Fnr family transcriptional regulator [Jiella sonneratiae]|uniref:Crp/Fnr family transcriptional regulator n=1 Tax=Jiella sonneratiae TaxID=2816856 RepID=A0ABS3JD79_9HYPH|nr:Crp/Fnr family transcriptional regulator [Jiella sonneratiae]MBO0906521.1 Crp/Fnr family transcriptional regulator [Jiella sonneratiae]
MMEAKLHYHPLIRHLLSTTDISEDNVRLLLELPIVEQDVGKGHTIVAEGDRPSRCCLILEGFTCRSRVLADGARQIVAFHVPGDLPDLQSLHLKRMDHSLTTLSPARLAFIPHEALRGLLRANHDLAESLWRRTLIDAAILREWVTSIGRKLARARIAHILCELTVRTAAVEVGNDTRIALPVTQNELADALGLTIVSVNRHLQEFRREGLLELRHRTLTIYDWSKLRHIAEFDSDYLHFTRPPDAVSVLLGERR